MVSLKGLFWGQSGFYCTYMIFVMCLNYPSLLFLQMTNVLCTGDNLQQLLELTEREISKLKYWFIKNKLSLNLNETNLMLFVNCKPNRIIKMEIYNSNIERVFEYHFLCIYRS